MDSPLPDLQFAVRQLRKSPAFAVTAIVSLAVGLAASTTVFSLADALLFRPRPGIAKPDRLVDIGRTTARRRVRHDLVPELRGHPRRHPGVRRRGGVPNRTRPARPRRPRQRRSGLRSGGLGQLLHGAGSDARSRPLLPAIRGACHRTRRRGGHQRPPLAPAFRRRPLDRRHGRSPQQQAGHPGWRRTRGVRRHQRARARRLAAALHATPNSREATAACSRTGGPSG